ncbi:MAG: DNA polymerase I [Planctomycetaceae bacterium]|nr:DNA polymerase I [Planctomycetaceae bacterium]
MQALHDQTVFVLDTHGILHQLFHALPEMSSPQGEPVGAVFGFARDLLSLLSRYQPDYVFCAYDLPGGTFRNELYPRYKENRKEMDESLRSQIPLSRELLEAFSLPILALEGFEADDILATVAHQVEQAGGRCVLVTSDKDCRQLLTDRVTIFNLRKQQFYTGKELLDDWGIQPGQVVDFQALCGDSTDNVPGVALIGPKIATELLQKYGTLENVLDHAGEVSGTKRKQNLLEGREIALLSRRLVELRKDVPLGIDWNLGKYQGTDPQKLKPLFQRLGFKSLLDKLSGTTPGTAGILPAIEPGGRLFSQEFEQAGSLRSQGFQACLVDSPELFEEFYAKLGEQKCFSYDSETTDVRPRFAKIVGLAFCWNASEAYYLPFRGPLGAVCLDEKTTLERLRPVFENPEIGKIGQNLKYDKIVLRNAGIELAGIEFDTMIADYLLRAGEQNHNLDDMAELYLEHKTIRISELIGSGKKQRRMDEVPTEIVCEYAGEDAWVPWLLRPVLERKLSQIPEMYSLFTNWELPLLEVLADMEFHGIAVDTALLKELSERFALRLAELEEEIFEVAGEKFNVASPKQLQKILFDKLQLPVIKETKTGPSTDIEVLEELAEKHLLAKKIIEHRQLSKLKGTYIDAFPVMVHPQTGRIHTSFNQVVTATGRLSSNDPNLQNIPVRTREGREIRAAFVPDVKNGYDQLLSFDYSQIELRVLAHFSRDENLRKAFESGEDIHTSVASQVFGVSPDAVDPDMRRQAKAVNFGVIYGQSAFGLAKQLGITQDEATVFINAYFAKYGEIRVYLEEILDGCFRNGYVSTLLGRRRTISGVRSVRKAGQMLLPERTAVNTVIQGSAADLMKQAMIRIHRKLPAANLKANMLLQIHDELVFEVSQADLKPLKELVIREMSLDQPLRVPLVVDTEIGFKK